MVQKFIDQSKRDIIENNIDEDNYCVIVYTTISSIKSVKFIYEDLTEFSLKIDAALKTINPMYGIDFQLWFFD